MLNRLPKEKYSLLKNVTLPTQDGTTQIDHILLSPYGIFVIETKNLKGWIFGSEKQAKWTQQIYKYRAQFQNPLRQNYKHLKTLEARLGCSGELLQSVVVFVGDSTFKTTMPAQVTDVRGLLPYIKSFTEVLLDEATLTAYETSIVDFALPKGVLTDIAHVQHVKQIVKEKAATKSCPRCGAAMVERTAKRGANAGKTFWGCSRFPQCRGVER